MNSERRKSKVHSLRRSIGKQFTELRKSATRTDRFEVELSQLLAQRLECPIAWEITKPISLNEDASTSPQNETDIEISYRRLPQISKSVTPTTFRYMQLAKSSTKRTREEETLQNVVVHKTSIESRAHTFFGVARMKQLSYASHEFVYIGTFASHIPDGDGLIFDRKSGRFVYMGEFAKGRPHGRGSVLLESEVFQNVNFKHGELERTTDEDPKLFIEMSRTRCVLFRFLPPPPNYKTQRIPEIFLSCDRSIHHFSALDTYTSIIDSTIECIAFYDYANLHENVREIIRESSVFVTFVSDSYFHQKATLVELVEAFRKRKPVLAVFTKNVDHSMIFRTYHANALSAGELLSPAEWQALEEEHIIPLDVHAAICWLLKPFNIVQCTDPSIDATPILDKIQVHVNDQTSQS